jgi:hypothetical protein
MVTLLVENHVTASFAREFWQGGNMPKGTCTFGNVRRNGVR